MSKDSPPTWGWEPPQPKQIVFGAPGVGKTVSAPKATEKKTSGKEGEGGRA